MMELNLTEGVITHDRSRYTTDQQCRRRRYWAYDYAGRGLTPDGLALELFLGLALHDSLAAIATQQLTEAGVDIQLIAYEAQKQVFDCLMAEGTGGETYAAEQACLIEGLIRGFYRHVWPRLMAEYPKIVAIEQEMLYPHHGITFMARPDLVLETAEGDLAVIEYKSSSSKKAQWINSWDYAVQLHSSVRAIEHTLGRPVAHVVVQGLYKGWIDDWGKQTSPLVYGYKRNGNPPFSQDEIAYKYKAGFKRTPVWEMPGGVEKWVAGMPEATLSEQFPRTPPIFVKDELVEQFFKQTAVREQEIHLSKQMLEFYQGPEREGVLNMAFPQNFEACQPAWGRGCPFKQLCFGDASDPLRMGFSERVPNHPLEQERWLEVERQHQQEQEDAK